MSLVLLCLENVQKSGKQLEPNCIAEMLDNRRMLMQDYSLTPNLVKYCGDEISQFCNNGLEKGGVTLHCLWSAWKTKSDPMCMHVCTCVVHASRVWYFYESCLVTFYAWNVAIWLYNLSVFVLFPNFSLCMNCLSSLHLYCVLKSWRCARQSNFVK